VLKDFMTSDGGSQALSALFAFSANGYGRAAEAQNCYGLGYRYGEIAAPDVRRGAVRLDVLPF
jgi:hypothetical protein